MARKVSFAEACAQFPHRFTADHIPAWARTPHKGMYYAPQWASDKAWYDAHLFPGEEGLHGNSRDCQYNGGQEGRWPLGEGFLKEPYHQNREQRAEPHHEVYR